MVPTTLSLLMGAAKNYFVGPIADPTMNSLIESSRDAQVRATCVQIIGGAHRHFTADQLRCNYLGN